MDLGCHDGFPGFSDFININYAPVNFATKGKAGGYPAFHYVSLSKFLLKM
jgi:hypothetical protein